MDIFFSNSVQIYDFKYTHWNAAYDVKNATPSVWGRVKPICAEIGLYYIYYRIYQAQCSI